jgi:hypothetical protein
MKGEADNGKAEYATCDPKPQSLSGFANSLEKLLSALGSVP